MVADQAVENAAGLLGFDFFAVDDAGMLHAGFDAFFGDLVEEHAVDFRLAGFIAFIGALDELGDMPGDGFSLAIRIGGKEDFLGPARGC